MDRLALPILASVALCACSSAGQTYRAPAEGEHAEIRGYYRNFLVAADEISFDLVSADNQELVAFVKRAKVEPGRYCVRARRWTMFLRGSDMQMSDTACFDAEGGHIYRIRRREDGFAIIDRKDPTVVSLAPAEQT
ncbi:MAG: hypothetical protein JSV45_04225 [Chromatiales bacterium]|nr:MAG: hypothetical protein JSV45_04225 [Chromatiales bacterium]